MKRFVAGNLKLTTDLYGTRSRWWRRKWATVWLRTLLATSSEVEAARPSLYLSCSIIDSSTVGLCRTSQWTLAASDLATSFTLLYHLPLSIRTHIYIVCHKLVWGSWGWWWQQHHFLRCLDTECPANQQILNKTTTPSNLHHLQEHETPSHG